MSSRETLLAWLAAQYPDTAVRAAADWIELSPEPAALPDLAAALVERHGCEFAALVIEYAGEALLARYFFHAPDHAAVIHLAVAVVDGRLPAISDHVHAADWHEREAGDVYGLVFDGHPFLGDFVLHDDAWPEGVEPMRHTFNASQRVAEPGKGAAWRPRRILDQDGAIAFPAGPIWADYNEAGLWILETPGEQIHECQTRLFYKYRAVEKIAEGQTPQQALLLAERFSGNSAFAHAWAYCQALETIAGCNVPPRAEALRLVFAELERIRYHAAVLAELAGSTSLAVGKSMSQEIEETLLRLTAVVCGHRYLYGLCVPGGLANDFSVESLDVLRDGLMAAAKEFNNLERRFVRTSSHLDRLEEMGTLRPDVADLYGVVGPVARASGLTIDLRRSLPYGAYVQYPPDVPREIEGDGYARMRLYYAEIRASTELIQALLGNLPDGPVATDCPVVPEAALGWVEAPAGGAFHWLRVGDDGRVARWHIAPPGFRNWHAFHRALEGAAFQDFHIVMAGFGLSVAESDR